MYKYSSRFWKPHQYSFDSQPVKLVDFTNKKMEQILSALNATQLVEKPLIRIDEMQIGKQYIVTGVKEANTRFGRKIILELEDNVMFLPDRYTALFTEDWLNYFNTSSSQQFLFCVEKMVDKKLIFSNKIRI